MTSENEPPVKYHVEMNQAQGPVIGDYAYVEQHFHAAAPPATRDEWLAAIHQANAELRTYPDEIAGIHIERTEVAEIVAWIHQADPKEKLGVIVDHPGSGKTVVMHDVLIKLEGKVPVLAIKADYLSGIKDQEHLARRLGLPASVEVCASTLAAEGRFVVLLDQLDALSLALSRDQATLDTIWSMLVHLRGLDNVRIVASCRTFDLNNDPRLSKLKVDKTFALQPLTSVQVDGVLQAVGIDSTHLLPAHQTLLTTPLHLDVYARVVAADSLRPSLESFYTLQELYEALWQKRISGVPPDSPPPSERSKAIYRLVDAMQDRRQIAAPIAVLDDYGEAAAYLEGANFIRREGRNCLFFHETLFDYCYARRFVAQNRSLSEEILTGSQGLFERSQMVQILAYLRGADAAACRRELTALLFAGTLRVHLRLLLMGWFGSLPDPTADELQIAQRLMKEADDRTRFFGAVSGNEGWFDQLREETVPTMLQGNDELQINLATSYLTTMIRQRTEDVLSYLHPYLGASERWDERISLCLTNLKSWHSHQAIAMLCDLFRRRRTFRRETVYLYELRANPAVGCRVLRIYLDRRLDDILEQLQEPERSEHQPNESGHIEDRFAQERYLLGNPAIGKLMATAVETCPDKILERLLPWFIRATTTLSDPRYPEDDYPFDFIFASYWYSDHLREGASFSRQIAAALCDLAKENPQTFRALASELAKVESLAVQRVLVEAYLSNPSIYCEDAFAYLSADSRRLNLGEPIENPHYDSGRLYIAIFPYLDEAKRQSLEEVILQLTPGWEQRNRGNRGITQLTFLKGIPLERLSTKARRQRRELEDKFPDFKLQSPRGITGGTVGAPIEQDAQAKMSDDAWLKAMRRYDDDTVWGSPRKDFLKGGVVELSRSFTEQVKQDPRRFYYLAQRFDESISLHYVTAAITGLAESDAPAEWAFDLVRRFADRLQGEFRRHVCWALSKRAGDGVPDELLDLMTEWALFDSDPEQEMWNVLAGNQPYYRSDPHEHGINTNRGSAILAVCHCSLMRVPPQVERVFELLERASQGDPSTAVRACIIDSLGPLINKDSDRALTILEHALKGHDTLLQSPLAQRFLYWIYRKQFKRVRPFIENMLSSPDENTLQTGASLVCLAALYFPEVSELAQHIVRGDEVMRRGAAQVYAQNLGDEGVGKICRERLLQLMYDPDEEVRRQVGRCFIHLRADHLDRLRSFISAFMDSPALLVGAEHLIEYLSPLAVDEHTLVLQATARILDEAGNEIVDIQTVTAILEQDVVRLPLTVYTHAVESEIRARAMDLFERLLLLGSQTAHKALADWDRR